MLLVMHFLSTLTPLYNGVGIILNFRIDGEGVIKVADFGLTEDMYNTNYFRRTRSEEKVPIRWMAPESIEHSTYTEATDVVSFPTLN